MLRKLMAIGAMAAVVVSAACNSVTGPAEDVSPTNNSGRRSGQPRDQRIAKSCLDLNRAVEIQSPIEGQILHNGQIVLVSFEVKSFCAGYTAAIEVSTDGGYSFQELASGPGLTSALWGPLAEADGLKPVVRVRAWDLDGTVQADRAPGYIYVEHAPVKRGQERD